MYKLPVHLIRQYLFCPRVVYFLEVLSIPKEVPIWVKEGEVHHKNQETLFKRRTMIRFSLENAEFKQNVNLYHEHLDFHGLCDALIITNDSVFPVEIKLHGDKPTKSQKMQLIAYGILAEKIYNKKFNMGFICFDKKAKTIPIELTTNIRNDFFNLVDEIIDLIKDGKLPNSNAEDEKCTQCEFLNYCNDRF